MPWSSFFECWVLSQLFHSHQESLQFLFSFCHKGGVICMVDTRLSIFLPAILIPACASSSPAFCMMYSACKLNKQGDTIQSWCTPLPIWNQFPKLLTSVGSQKKHESSRKTSTIDYAKACDCVDHNKLENSERDGNTRPPDLPLEKPTCRSGSNS